MGHQGEGIGSDFRCVGPRASGIGVNDGSSGINTSRYLPQHRNS